jgi:hypothetical protein
MDEGLEDLCHGDVEGQRKRMNSWLGGRMKCSCGSWRTTNTHQGGRRLLGGGEEGTVTGASTLYGEEDEAGRVAFTGG